MAKKKIKSTKKRIPKSKKKVRKKSGIFNNLILVVLSILLPYLFLSLSKNDQWIKGRILNYYKDISRQMDQLDTEARKKERHGVTFQIADYVCKNVPAGSWVLMPPQAYYLDNMYDVQKPNEVREIYQFISTALVFNFHCQDIKVLTMDMKEEDIAKAQYALNLTPQKGMKIVRIENEASLSSVIKQFDYDLPSVGSRNAAIETLKKIQSN